MSIISNIIYTSLSNTLELISGTKKKREKLTDHTRRNCNDDEKKGQRVMHRKKFFLLNNTNVKCKNVNTN